MLFKRLVGDRAFYRTLLAVTIPILVQSGITNFISLLDNVMVGTLGTEAMSGVSIVNQLIFVFNLCIFGSLSGAGLFGAQFFGKGDHEGLRHTFRFKLLFSLFLCGAAILIFEFFGEALISLYLHEGSETGDLALTMQHAGKYLSVSLFGLLPYTVTNVYASTLRETGNTLPPMKAGLLGVAVNLLFNLLLIFGLCGFPALGVTGAAIATVIARFAECITVVLWTHLHKDHCEFIKGAYRSFAIPASLVRRIALTGAPLLANETFWAVGQAMLLQCYSLRGIAVVSAMNISNTLFNTFAVVYLSIGTAISILLGHRLGAGETDRARTEAPQMIAFAGVMGLAVGIFIIAISPFFPLLYNTSEEVRAIATGFTVVVGCYAPFNAILNSSYYTLRSGGKTVITFLFDCGYVWLVNIPTALLLITMTSLSPVLVYTLAMSTELFKLALGIFLVKRGVWLNDITVHPGKEVKKES